MADAENNDDDNDDDDLRSTAEILADIHRTMTGTDGEWAITNAARKIRTINRSTLIASRADGNFKRLDLLVDEKVAQALVDDRLLELNDRRHLMWKSGVVGALIAGAFAMLLWWLRQDGA